MTVIPSPPVKLADLPAQIAGRGLKGRAAEIFASSSSLADVERRLADPDAPQRHQVVPGLMPRGLTIAKGASGSRKTTVTIGIAIRLAADLQVTGPGGAAGPVLFVAAEDRDGAEVRGLAMARHLDLDAAELPLRFISPPCEIHAPGFADEVIAIGQSMALGHGRPLAAVVLDTLGATFGSTSMNDDGPMLAAANAGLAIANALTCAVVVTHHPPKTGQGERGSLVLRDRADVVLHFDIEPVGLRSRVTVEKARNGPSGRTYAFDFQEHEITIGDLPPITALVVTDVTQLGQPAAQAVAPKAAAAWQPKGDAAAILKVLEQSTAALETRQIQREEVRVRILTALSRGRKRKGDALRAALSTGLKLLRDHDYIDLDGSLITVRNLLDSCEKSHGDCGSGGVRISDSRPLRAGSKSHAQPQGQARKQAGGVR